jgi:hypothetical protein
MLNIASSSQPTRVHADIFTPLEAANYLKFSTERSLETLRKHYNLVAHRVGKSYFYHREDLDACALRMFGKDRKGSPKGRTA